VLPAFDTPAPGTTGPAHVTKSRGWAVSTPHVLAARDDGAGHAQVVRTVPGSGTAVGRLCAASDPRADGAAVTDPS
jgi:hypothetical protein